MTKGLRIFFRIAFFLYLAAVAVLCFGHFSSLPEVSKTILGIPTDKVVHFFMFLPFPILAFLAYDKLTGTVKGAVIFALVSFAAGCVIAGATELGQAYLTDYRSGDPTDFAADAMALALGAVISAWIDIKQLKK